ncbi:MAG: ribosomal-processing cysteine protease Prp [Eubacterium sp.]|nr:ribosomal-processing cysteine protease Prp [Eubacterium sp.]
MINVQIRRSDNRITGFSIDGHSGYAKKGEDIVCSAISILAINTVNSIEALTDDEISVSDADGHIDVELQGKYSDRTKVLVDSMILGIQGVIEEYGKEFVDLKFTDA